MNLRWYQTEAIELIQQLFAKGFKRNVLCSPTGSGKTVMFSEIAWKAFMKGKRVVILTHRKELLKQAGKFNNNGCEICMVETLHNKIKKGTFDINKVDLLIIDEAHIGSFTKILEHYKGFVIGATATPSNKMKKLYEEIVCNVDIPILIGEKFLSYPQTFVKQQVDVKKLEANKKDYTEQSLDGLYNKPKVYAGVVDDYIAAYKGMKSIYFCVNVDATINTAAEFAQRGINTFLVHSKQADWDRDRQVQLFNESKDAVMVNCGILTAGYDCPDVLLIGVVRATKSLALWLQMCGRGSRVIDGIKTRFTILDYGENVIRLGHWEAERDWHKIFHTPEKKKKGEQAAPVKECENCHAVVYASAKKCPHCGAEFPIESIIIPEGELIEMFYKKAEGNYIFNLDYEEIFELARLKTWKQAFVERILFHNPRFQTKNHLDLKDSVQLQKFWDTKEYKPQYRDRRLEIYRREKPISNFIVKK